MEGYYSLQRHRETKLQSSIWLKVKSFYHIPVSIFTSADAEQEGKFNVAFLSNMLTGNMDACLNLLVSANRLPEAAMFCRTYLPSKTAEITQKWKGNKIYYLKDLLTTNIRFSDWKTR